MTPCLALRPFGLRPADEAPAGSWSLAGGPLRFTECEAIWRDEDGRISRRVVAHDILESWTDERELAALAAETLARLEAPREPFAGLDGDRPLMMGVINVTPDSFSDGGDHAQAAQAIATGLDMLEAGADILDVGGESTRPGADPVSLDEELARVLPVIRALAEHGAVVSIDSRRAEVMRAALETGARIINDVTALTGDPDALSLAAETAAPVVLMHMQGEPQTMQQEPRYEDVTLEVIDYLAARIARCEAKGIPRARIAIDPGIGFGKTVDHNLTLLNDLAALQGLGCPVLLGVSRKSFIGRLSCGETPKARLPGSLAAALAGLARGVQILRVHDVAETLQAVRIWRAIMEQGLRIS